MQVSASAYAKHRGVALQTVMTAIQKGRIQAVTKLDTGRYKVDVEKADAEWKANTDTGQGRPAHVQIVVDRADEPDLDQPISYAEARAQHERFKARLAELELEEREKKLVQADVVKRESFRVARLVRDAMLNIPDRVAAELAAEGNQFKVHQRLTHEIRRALEDLKLE